MLRVVTCKDTPNQLVVRHTETVAQNINWLCSPITSFYIMLNGLQSTVCPYSLVPDEDLNGWNIVLLHSTVLWEMLNITTDIWSHNHEPLSHHHLRMCCSVLKVFNAQWHTLPLFLFPAVIEAARRKRRLLQQLQRCLSSLQMIGEWTNRCTVFGKPLTESSLTDTLWIYIRTHTQCLVNR